MQERKWGDVVCRGDEVQGREKQRGRRSEEQQLSRKEHDSYQDVKKRRRWWTREEGSVTSISRVVSLIPFWESLPYELKWDLRVETACLHLAIAGMNSSRKNVVLCLQKWLYTLKAGQTHIIPLYQYIFVLFRVSSIQKPGLDDRWKRGGRGIRFFPWCSAKKLHRNWHRNVVRFVGFYWSGFRTWHWKYCAS